MTTQQSNFSQLIQQYVRRHNVLKFTRQQLLNDVQFNADLLTITASKTPESQSDYLLQVLRDNNQLVFVDYDGTYEVVTNLG